MPTWPKFSLKKIQVGENREYFLLLKTESEEELPDVTVELTNGAQSFRGSISSKQMQEHLQKSRLDQSAFVKLTISALTHVDTDENSEHFSYSLDATSPENWTVTWKKFIPAEGIKFQLGSAMLQSVTSAETISSILDSVTDRIAHLEGKVALLEKDKETVELEKEKLIATLRDKVYEKTELEKMLMTKFVLVLNTKKSKIRELKLEVQSLKESLQESRSVEDNGHSDFEEPESAEKKMVSKKKSSLDSSLRLSQDDLDVPSTSKHVRRVRPARTSRKKTSPIASKKKRSVNRREDQSSGNISDPECDTLELMDDMF